MCYNIRAEKGENMLYILIGIVILLLSGVIIRIHYEITHFEIVRDIVYTDKIKNPCRMVLITDLHGCTYGDGNEKLLQAIQKEQPEIILIAGDLFTAKRGKKIDTDAAVELLEVLSKQYLVFYTNGNHETRAKIETDLYGNAYQEYLDLLKKKQIEYIPLNDQKVDLDKNNITIAGVELEEEYYRKTVRKIKLPKEYLQNKLGVLDRSRFNILIAHNPSYFDAYAQYGADLIVSGHNHGGIVCLPFIGGVISTQYRLFDKYDKGTFFKNQSEMILSGGLGSHTINVRLGNMPQLIVIDLKKA